MLQAIVRLARTAKWSDKPGSVNLTDVTKLEEDRVIRKSRMWLDT